MYDFLIEQDSPYHYTLSMVKTASYEMVIPSDIQEVAKVEKFLKKIKRALDIDEERFYKILVAVTEAVNNGIIHGNKRDAGKNVFITCHKEDTILTFSIRDEGPGFDNENLPDPLAEENLMRDHGRGVFLIRSLMEKVSYDNSKGSMVTMSIRLSQ
jgi:serine/threonine-protein kinase RsbW